MLKSIQCLRGLAAVMVVAFHVLAMGPQGLGMEHGGGFLSGGVDIFFCISGFVMVLSTATRKVSFRDFMVARLVRIAPLYIVATLLAVCAHQWLLHGVPPVKDIVLSCLFIPYTNSLNHQPVPILGVGWTLDYEMFFYLVFGATLVLRRKSQLWTLAALFTLLVLLRPVIGHGSAASLRFTSPLFFEFLAGALLGSVRSRLENKPSVYGCALLLGGFALGFAVGRFAPQLPRTLGFGVPALMIVAGAVLMERFLTGKAWAAFLALGNASYSIYLFHFIPIAFAENAHAGTYGALQNTAMLIAGVATGFAAYFLIERPLLQASRSLLRRIKVPPTAIPRVPADVL